jgi:hypothetical protein
MSNHSRQLAVVSLPVVLAMMLLGGLPGCSQTQPMSPSAPQSAEIAPPPPAPLAPASTSSAPPSQDDLVGVGAATVVTVHGKIVSVDRENKLVTLQGPGGKQLTVHAYNAYNLAAAKPGDPFVAKFYEIATIRKLMPGESPPPASLAQGIVSAAPGQTPGGAIGRQIQFVVTLDAINKSRKTVSVEGPDGAAETVKVSNPENLDRVQVGEKIVVTLTDVIAISLDKESAS